MLFRKFNGILNQINSLVDKIIKKNKDRFMIISKFYFLKYRNRKRTE